MGDEVSIQINGCLNSTGRQGLKAAFSWFFDFGFEVAAEKLAMSPSDGLGLFEESVFCWVWRGKADPSVVAATSGWQTNAFPAACEGATHTAYIGDGLISKTGHHLSARNARELHAVLFPL